MFTKRIFKKSWFKKLLFVTVCFISSLTLLIMAGKNATSQPPLIADLPSGEYNNPELIKEAFKDKPDYGYSPYAGGREFPNRVFWGDTHLHTTYSFDAGAAGNRLDPEEAYKFARGEEVTSSTGQKAKLSRPLDFLVVADHSDGLGAFSNLLKGTPEILANETTKKWHEAVNEGGQTAANATVEIIGQFSQGTIPQVVLPTGDKIRTAWHYEIDTAEKYNDPHNFTTFIGYEWTSLVKGNNLHRVVIFRDDAEKAKQVMPVESRFDQDPENLWKAMDMYEQKTGGQILAIPHNGNLSNGLMFADTTLSGKPLTQDYAENRQRWEPLYEVTQIKGDGETHPFLSPNDEFADFETWDNGNLDLSETKKESMLKNEYARSALKMGLEYEEKLGTNPYKFGMIGSTDSHTSLTAVEENNFFGKLANSEPSPERAFHKVKTSDDKTATIMSWEYAAAGYAGVWARENTREALFDAMKRREVFATTGPRMLVRFFGGWDFQPEDAFTRNPADVGYNKGVPMGGDLSNAPSDKAPTFLVAALKDPIGANLDRIQIVKGYLDDNKQPQEKVYDVVLSDNRKVGMDGKAPPVGNTVDVSKAVWTNTIGDVEMISVWTDPDFKPNQRAFYYARVLQIPTPRWTDYDAVYFKEEMPKEVPLTIQERVYTSPIWYSPI